MTDESDTVESIEVRRDGALVKIVVADRDDLALTLHPNHASMMAMHLQRAAADAKQYQRENDIDLNGGNVP